MSKVNSNGFWRRLGSAFERADIDDGASAWSATDEDAVRTTTTRYAPIREAVERRVQSFMRQDLVSHLEIGFNEIFLLHYIEIAADGQGAAQLEQFLREFPAESRVQWVKKLFGVAMLSLAVFYASLALAPAVVPWIAPVALVLGGMYLGFVDRSGSTKPGFRRLKYLSGFVATALGVVARLSREVASLT